MATTSYTNATANVSHPAVQSTTPIADPTNLFDASYRIILPSIFGLITVVGVIGNGWVVAAGIRRGRGARTRSINRRLIVYLALADIAFLVICVPFTALEYVLAVWPAGEVMCKGIQYLIYVSGSATIYILAVMAVDRCLAIVFPLRSRAIRTMKNVHVVLACLAVTVLILNLPVLIFYQLISYTDLHGARISTCSNQGHAMTFLGMTVKHFYFRMFFVTSYCIPLAVIFTMYGAIVRTLVTRRVIQASNTNQQQVMARHYRAAKIVFVVVIAFLVCWTPIQVLIFLDNFTDVIPRTRSVAVAVSLFTANCMAYANSCINPLLYSALSTRCSCSCRVSCHWSTWCRDITGRRKSVSVAQAVSGGSASGSTQITPQP